MRRRVGTTFIATEDQSIRRRSSKQRNPYSTDAQIAKSMLDAFPSVQPVEDERAVGSCTVEVRQATFRIFSSLGRKYSTQLVDARCTMRHVGNRHGCELANTAIKDPDPNLAGRRGRTNVLMRTTLAKTAYSAVLYQYNQLPFGFGKQ